MVVGDVPFWDDDTNSLYYIDLFGKAFYRYSYDEDKVYKLVVDSASYATFIQPIEGHRNRFLIGINGTASVFNWDGHSSEAAKVKDVFSIAPNTNFNSFTVGPNNDFIAGGFGGVFCGSEANISLYQYDAATGELCSGEAHYKSITGLALNEKENTLYNLDACTQTIKALDYNPQNGDLCKTEIHESDVRNACDDSSVFHLNYFVTLKFPSNSSNSQPTNALSTNSPI